MTGLSTYLRGLWVTCSVRMWFGWQTQCDVPCLCISACISIRARAAFASCFYGSDDTHLHISDCQEASVCIRANSYFLKTQYSHNALWASLITHAVQLPVQVSLVKVLYGLWEAGRISQGGPALSYRMPCLREFFLIHTYSPKHLSLRLKSLNQHYVDLQGPHFSKRPDSFGFHSILMWHSCVIFCLFSSFFMSGIC